MDSRHFDALTRVLSTANARRTLLAGLAALPVAGGLLGILDAEEAEAGRRRRRKRQHRRRHDKGKGRKRKPRKKGKQKPGCTPDCAGKCQGMSDGCGGACDTNAPSCEGPPCRTQLQSCTAIAECCATESTACAHNNVFLDTNVCCSTLGGACTEGGVSGDCCVVDVPSGRDYAYCSAGGACGGEGARCRYDEACVSGACCKELPGDDFGICSGAIGCP